MQHKTIISKDLQSKWQETTLTCKIQQFPQVQLGKQRFQAWNRQLWPSSANEHYLRHDYDWQTVWFYWTYSMLSYAGQWLFMGHRYICHFLGDIADKQFCLLRHTLPFHSLSTCLSKILKQFWMHITAQNLKIFHKLGPKFVATRCPSVCL